MNSLITKILKTFFSIIITFILCIIIVTISLYIYIGKGLEFEIDQSNSLIASLSEEYSIDFDKSSTINLIADSDKVDVYVLLKDVIVDNDDNNNILKAPNASLKTHFSYTNIMMLGNLFFDNQRISYNLVDAVNIHLNEPILNIKYINSLESDSVSKDSEFFPLNINAESGVLFDGVLELGTFSMALNMNQFEKKSDIQSYSFELESHKDFPADYIGQFFEEVVLLYGENESVYFIWILRSRGNTPENTQILNGTLRVRDTKLDLKEFPVELKPESIRNLNIDLNVIDNIGQINFLGSVTNPKVKLKLQKDPNLQITGSIDFEETSEPYLNLTVNGTDIYFAKLDNNNLNGITDLRVLISGKNVLDLAGELNIKKSNGFLVPLTNSTFETQHIVKKENDE